MHVSSLNRQSCSLKPQMADTSVGILRNLVSDIHLIFWELTRSLELYQNSDLSPEVMLSERGFAFLQGPEESVCLLTSVFWRVTRCEISARLMLAFPEEELVKDWSLAEPCRWCCVPRLAVSVLESSPATGLTLCGEHGDMQSPCETMVYRRLWCRP